MNTQLHRKQVIILALAIALAAASYWIPLPQQAESQPSQSKVPESTGQATAAEAIVFMREPATIWRFPVTVKAPQVPVPAISMKKAENEPSADVQPATQLIDLQDFSNSDKIRLPNPPLMPVKELNRYR